MIYGAAQVDFFITAVDFGPEPEPEKVLPCPVCHPPCTQPYARRHKRARVRAYGSTRVWFRVGTWPQVEEPGEFDLF